MSINPLHFLELADGAIAIRRQELYRKRGFNPNLYARKKVAKWGFVIGGVIVCVAMIPFMVLHPPHTWWFLASLNTGFDAQQYIDGIAIGLGIGLPIIPFALLQKKGNRKRYLQQNRANTYKKQWILALSSLYFEIKKERIKKYSHTKKAYADYLDMGAITFGDFVVTQEILKKYWGIHDHSSALKVINRLIMTGHRHQYYLIQQNLKLPAPAIQKILLEKGYKMTLEQLQQKIEAVWEGESKLDNNNIIGWDMARAVDVIRMCYTIDYLSAQDAWRELSRIGPVVQKTLTSWRQFYYSWVVGRKFWNGQNPEKAYVVAGHYLLNNPKSPWVRLRWKTPLD